MRSRNGWSVVSCAVVSCAAICCAMTAWASVGHAAVLVNLGTLGGSTSFALDVNNQRQVTGNAQLPLGEPNPRLNTFLFTSAGPMVGLGVLPGSNNFSRGDAINDAGDIVGFGTFGGSTRAFLLVIPEPSALGVLAPAGVLLMRRRRAEAQRRRKRGEGEIRPFCSIVRTKKEVVMRLKYRLAWVSGVMALSGLAPAAASATLLFDIRPLGLTPAGTSNQARGISDDGQIIAGYENIAGGFQRGIGWAAPAPAVATGTGLPSYSPAITSVEGHAVNSSGVLVGVARYSAPPPGSPTGSVPYDRGVVFTPAGGAVVLEPFNSAGGRRAFAQAVNDANRVVGNGSSDPVLTNQNPRRAFWYDANPAQSTTTVYKLDPAVNGLPLLPGGNWSVAYGINQQQQIVGFAQAPDDAATPVNRNRAVIWSAGVPDANGNPYTTVQRIDPRNDGTSSLARDISDTGVVVGRMALSATGGDEAAFIHRPGDPGLTSLGKFNGTRTEAIDIGGNGWIVGYAGATEGSASNTNVAVLWIPDATGEGGYRAYDLLGLVSAADPLNGGWTRLLEARQVSADGTIVGYGRYVATPGGAEVTRGFVLTVIPEPGSLAFLAPAALLMARRRAPSN